MEDRSSQRLTTLSDEKADVSTAASGYEHPSYAQALSGFGRPRSLAHCGGSILLRDVYDSAGAQDAMGCYPLFACRDWSQLPGDLEELEGEIVSLTLVADPFGEYDASHLQRAFKDLCAPFKEHFVADLRRAPDAYIDSHHRRNARRALAALDVEVAPDPAELLDEWLSLYAALTERHAIRGVAAFSRESFDAQLKVPGLTALRASREGRTVGITLWYESRGVAYYHLGAYSSEGYDLRASFALFRRAFEHFADAGLSWLNFGAGAGVSNAGDDGLTRFKRGWASGTRTAHLCGRVFDRRRYDELTRERGMDALSARYFPAYRAGEFG